MEKIKVRDGSNKVWDFMVGKMDCWIELKSRTNIYYLLSLTLGVQAISCFFGHSVHPSTMLRYRDQNFIRALLCSTFVMLVVDEARRLPEKILVPE